ncbi:MAG: flagellar filament outer layer protein FlaA [Treponema sp.]|jgi:hypothetical protein|nr:flagellar filament outer layer protein FlaA [Treponema sp.]
MKRIFILVVVMLAAVGLFADEAVLIDFTKFARDIIPAPGQDSEMTQNRATLMDYGAKAGASFTQEQKGMMRTSLALKNWTVRLNSSARSSIREINSYVDEAESKLYGTVMGVRISFPTEPWNSNAFIKPPFEIPAYDFSTISDAGEVAEPESSDSSQRSRFEGTADGDVEGVKQAFGVVKNVGAIKQVAVHVYGLNFPHSLSVILIDNNGNEKMFHVDYLNFDGWRDVIWINPAYIQEVRNRELRLEPLYPTATPFVKFGGFLIKRDADKIGGDFITYFRDVKIIYDKAVLDPDRDINDEGLWHIIGRREDAKKRWEMSRFGENQILQYLEQQKKATESAFTQSPSKDGGTN